MLHVWIASFPAFVRQFGRKLFPNRDAQTGTLKDVTAKADVPDAQGHPGNIILGAAAVRLVSICDDLEPLSPAEREQYMYWRRAAPAGVASLSGRLYRFVVDEAVALVNPAPFQQCSAARPHGFAIPMEEQQPERLIDDLPDCPGWLADDPCVMCLRLPLAYASCVVQGVWGTFLVPDFSGGSGEGGPGADGTHDRASKTCWDMQWQRLGISVEHLPRPRVNLGDQAFEAFAFDAGFATECADVLRTAVARLDTDRDDLERLGLLERVARACRGLQRFVDDMDAVMFRKRLRDFGGSRGGVDVLHNNVPYNAAFMINVLVQADMLRSDADLSDHVKRSVRMLLPPCLAAPVCELVDNAKLPHKSTISRWRLLLDTSLMLWHRGQRGASVSNAGFVRWMMVDSSPQGHRDYEMVMSSFAKVNDLSRMMYIVNALAGDRLGPFPLSVWSAPIATK